MPAALGNRAVTAMHVEAPPILAQMDAGLTQAVDGMDARAEARESDAGFLLEGPMAERGRLA